MQHVQALNAARKAAAAANQTPPNDADFPALPPQPKLDNAAAATAAAAPPAKVELPVWSAKSPIGKWDEEVEALEAMDKKVTAK